MIIFIKLSVTIAMNGQLNFRIVSFLNILLIVCLINLLLLFLINIHIVIQNHQYRSDTSDEML